MRNLILIFLILMSRNLISQQYSVFDSTTVWNTLRTNNFYDGSPCTRNDLFSYFVKGYLINNGILWHKVYVNVEQGKYYNAASSSTPCNTYTNSAITSSFVGLFNNDSLSKKIYFVPSFTLSPSFTPGINNLLFDFDKTINDTIWTYDSGNPASKIYDLSYKIIAIDSILFDGKYHKRFVGYKLFPLSYSPVYDYFIEGIGSSGGVFQAIFELFAQHASPLVCFSGISSTKYIKGVDFFTGTPYGIIDTNSCDFLSTGMPQLNGFNNLTVKIYPNPSNGIVTVSCSDPLQNKDLIITISDLLGHELKSSLLGIGDTEQVLDIGDLRNGIYFIKIQNPSGQKVFKVIKE